MKSLCLAQKRSLSLLVILSLVTSFFAVPMTVKAGILSSTLSALRPMLQIAGRIGGAVAGASLGAAFFPPLGMVAGAVAGWMVGGIITDYGTCSLTSLATLGGAAVGAMALASFGPIGMVAGLLAGGFIGRMAMSVLHCADYSTTGGLLFMNSSNSSGILGTLKSIFTGSSSTTTSSFSTSSGSSASTGASSGLIPTVEKGIQAAEDKYRKAYQSYVNCTDANLVKPLKASYEAALKEYQKLTNTTSK